MAINDDVNNLSKAIAEAIGNTSKFGKVFKKTTKENRKFLKELTDDFGDFQDELKNMPKLYKVVDKLSKKFGEIDDEVNDLASDLKQMGISSSVRLKKVTQEADKAANAFSLMSKKTAEIGKMQSKLNILPKKLKDIQVGLKKGFSKDNIKDFLDNMSDFESHLDPQTLEKFKGTIQKAFDTGDIEKANKAIHLLSSASMNNLLKDFKSMKESDAFKHLDGNTKQFVERLANMDGGVKNIADLEEHLKEINDYHPEIAAGFEKFFENSTKEAAELTKQIGGTKVIMEELTDIFRDASFLELNFGNLKAEAFGLIKEIQQRSGDAGLFPDDTVENVKKVEALQKSMNKETKLLHSINNEIDKLGEDDVARKEKLLSLQTQIAGRLSHQSNSMKEVAAYSRAYLDAAEEVDRGQFGVAQTADLMKNIFKASHRMDQMADGVANRFPGLSKHVKGLSKNFKNLGETVGKMKLGIGLLGSAASLAKHIMAVDERASKMYTQVQDSGLMVGTSLDNMTGAMEDFNSEANNIAGLTKAVAGMEGSFALSRDEIMGITTGLNNAGLASRHLAEQMKAIPEEIKGTSNALAGASKLVRTFSTNMAVADSVVTGMMGEMAHSFDSTMGTMTSTFTDITGAMQKSGMTANKFLGILGTSTAGLSLYEEQVSDTAAAIANMATQSSLSGREIELASKGAAEFAQNSQDVAKAFGLIGVAKMGKLAGSLAPKQKELQAKVSGGTATKEEKDRLMLINKMATALKEGNVADAGVLLKTMPADLALAVKGQMGQMIKSVTLDKGGKGAYLAYEEAMKNVGFSGEEFNRILTTNGEILDVMARAADGDKKAQGDLKNLMNKASKVEDKAGNATNELLQAIKDEATAFQKNNLGWLKALAALQAAAGAGDIIKNMGNFMKTGMAKNLASAITKSPLVSKLGPLLTKMAPMAGSVAALAAAGYIGYQVGDAFNKSDIGKGFSKWLVKNAGELSDNEKAYLKQQEQKHMDRSIAVRKKQGRKSDFKSVEEKQAWDKSAEGIAERKAYFKQRKIDNPELYKKGSKIDPSTVKNNPNFVSPHTGAIAGGGGGGATLNQTNNVNQFGADHQVLEKLRKKGMQTAKDSGIVG
ncbi:hypothetical protein N9948_01410 [bacterium]|nr:hypothetical protein [bacterium]